MKTVVFYGTSDDLIEVEGFEQPHEFNTESLEFFVEAEDLRMGVRVTFNDRGTWEVAPFLADEDDVWPDWNFRIERRHRHGRIENDPSHSLQMVMQVPDEAKLLVAR